MVLPTYTAAVGYDKALSVSLLDDTGAAQAWSASDTPTARVWRGGDQASLFTPTCAWVSATSGTLTVTIARTDTASLTPARYRLQVKVTRASDSKEFLGQDAWLVLTDAPGSGTVPDTYCTLDDMLDYAGELAGNLQESADETGFQEERAKACTWTRRTVLSRAGTLFDRYAESYTDLGEDWVTVLDAATDSVTTTTDANAVREAFLSTVRGYLTSGYLKTDKADDSGIVEANALYALALVYGRQLGEASKDVTFSSLAAQWMSRAIRRLQAATFRIDKLGTGATILRLEPC